MNFVKSRTAALLLFGATALGLGFTPQANAQETVGGGTVATPAVGPAPSFLPPDIAPSSMVLVKNWHFGTDGTIKNYADMSANFFYHDQFGTIANGTNYGAEIVAPDAADALYNQPIEGVNCPPVRQFLTDSLQTYLVPLNGATTVDPNLHNAGNGSFMAKWKLPDGGSRLGEDIVWETRVKYVTPPYFWFALWTAGNKWNGGAEQDLIESFGYDNGGGYTNFDGRYWHSNSVNGADTVDYSSWGNAMASVGIPSYDATQYHIWTWVYKHDNSYAMYVDGIKVQSGTGYNWTVGTAPTGEPIDMDFLFDLGWGHTQVQSVDHTLPASAFNNTDYEVNYSRVYLSTGGTEAAYNGPHLLPGTVQSEDYDTGGNGVAYNQTVNGGQTGYRTDNNADIHSGAGPNGNGYALGWSDAGDWYKYTVNVAATAGYTAAFQVASQGPGGTFHLEDEKGNNLTGSLTVPDTGGFGTWQVVTSRAFPLTAGAHTLRLVEDTLGANGWVGDFDWFSLSAANTLLNGSFEAPSVNGGYFYNPPSAGWTFSGGAGIQANGSPWGAANAPDGTQTAFLQGSGTLGSISQGLNLPAGTYTLTFQAARRNTQIQPVQVSLDGRSQGSPITPASSAFSPQSLTLTVGTTGLHTLALAATAGTGDNSTFVDQVALVPYTPVLLTGPVFSDGAGPWHGIAANAAPAAFDGKTNTFYDCANSSTGYVGIDAGTAQTVTKIVYAPRAGYEKRMVGGIFEGSSTSATAGYTTLATVTAVPKDGLVSSLSVTSTTAYRWLRYRGPAGSYGNVAEIQFLH